MVIFCLVWSETVVYAECLPTIYLSNNVLLCCSNQKEHKQVSIKKTSKKKSSWCIGMAQCMNALADKVHTNKKCHAHSDMHALHIMATLFNNHPYISSSGTPVGTNFTATYVEMVVEYCGHDMSAYQGVHGTFCLCILCQPVHSLSYSYIS